MNTRWECSVKCIIITEEADIERITRQTKNNVARRKKKMDEPRLKSTACYHRSSHDTSGDQTDGVGRVGGRGWWR